MRSDNVEETRSILQDTTRVFHLSIMVRSLGKDARQDSRLFLSCFHFKLAVSYTLFRFFLNICKKRTVVFCLFVCLFFMTAKWILFLPRM